MPKRDDDDNSDGKARRRGRPRTDIDITEEIEELTDRGYTATQIVKHLEGSDAFAERAPSLRTVQRIASGRAPEKGTLEGKFWNAASFSDAAEAKAVLAVLAAVIGETEGRVTYLTQEEAKTIGVLRESAEGLSGWDLYRLAREYIGRQNEITEDLDAFLALGAWHKENWERYGRAIDSNALLEPPRFLWLLGGLDVWRHRESSEELREALEEIEQEREKNQAANAQREDEDGKTRQ